MSHTGGGSFVLAVVASKRYPAKKSGNIDWITIRFKDKSGPAFTGCDSSRQFLQGGFFFVFVDLKREFFQEGTDRAGRLQEALSDEIKKAAQSKVTLLLFVFRGARHTNYLLRRRDFSMINFCVFL